MLAIVKCFVEIWNKSVVMNFIRNAQRIAQRSVMVNPLLMLAIAIGPDVLVVHHACMGHDQIHERSEIA